MKCKVCGKDLGNISRRAFNIHCVREHRHEYFGKTLEEMTEDPIPVRVHDLRDAARAKKKKQSKRKAPIIKKAKPARPAGFRLLSETDEDEAYAIEQGFAYIDRTQEVYTSEEAEEKGWV